MKVVLLAAGRSFRMQPILDKNFISFRGKALLEHQLEALRKAGFKEILVVGGKHNLESIEKSQLASRSLGVGVVEQKDLDLGMAGAILSAEKWIGTDPFLVVSANDVLDQSAYNAVATASKKGRGVLLAKRVTEYFPGGYLKIDTKGVVQTLIEKPGAGNEPSDLVNIVVHYHPWPREFIAALKKISSQRDDRYEQALQALFDEGKKYVAAGYEKFWQPVKFPWHILDLMTHFLPTKKGVVKGKNVVIAKTAIIHGPVVFGDNVRVFDNAVIQGPAYIGEGAVVATNALVRNSHIGARSVIGFGSEVARSYIGTDVWTHSNYIGDSVIGNNVSFGSGTVTGNLRLDEKEIPVVIKGEKVASGRTKMGLITGDDIRVGVNTSFMPGVKIGSGSFIGAGITVAQDVPENSFVTGEWKLKVRPNRGSVSPRKKL